MAKTTATIGTIASNVLYVRAAALVITLFEIKKRMAITNFFRISTIRNVTGDTSFLVILHIPVSKKYVIFLIMSAIVFSFEKKALPL